MQHGGNMMKAQGPKLETCLFGPSSTPIPIKVYRAAKSEHAESSIVNELFPSTRNEVENQGYDTSTTSASTNESLELNITGGYVDADTNIDADADATTPPQSPVRLEEPLRPTKPLSSTKSKEEPEAVPTATNDPSESPHTIKLQELRRLASQGVPDDCTLRPRAWRVL
jgi:hypothetical protein